MNSVFRHFNRRKFCQTLLLSLLKIHFTSAIVPEIGENFHEAIQTHDLTIVKFQAEWCGACKSMKEDYDGLATQMKGYGSVLIANVDCPANQDLCKGFEIKGYPTLKVFRKGEFFEDLFAREESDLVGYAKKLSGPISKQIENIDDFAKQVLASSTSLVLGFFDDEKSDSYQIFDELAQKLSAKQYKFFHSFDSEVKSGAGMSVDEITEKFPEGVMILHSPGMEELDDNQIQIYPNVLTDSVNLEEFILENYFGVLPLLTNEQRGIFSIPKQIMVFFEWKTDEMMTLNHKRGQIYSSIKNSPELLKITGLAQRRQQGQLFVDLNLVDEFNQLGEVTVIGFDGKRAFFKERNIKLVDLEEWGNNFLKNQVEERVKSEQVSTKTHENGNVWKLVGKNVRKLALESDKDVFLMAYAPWCGHCKDALPKWKQLAEELMIQENFVVADIDATVNTMPEEFPVRGYPTIFWIGADGRGVPVKYDGDRKVGAWRRFVKQQMKSRGRKGEL